jgi:hypothetical protein
MKHPVYFVIVKEKSVLLHCVIRLFYISEFVGSTLFE